ncbi:hypothetical protein ACHAXA_005953 [Cyclostephanos tholiformis]|uniref:TonB C-terminal domain-containing protein n=1 Tax=Cyclostephanos tholiformis TaxID=382380 RepID=A0ABD3SE39_9STRA
MPSAVMRKVTLLASVMAICLSASPTAQAFVSSAWTYHSRTGASRLHSDGGGIEEIEFRVYPDGRVTEIVRGVRGKNCQDITEAINKQLGNVVASQPTEEFFEEEVLVQATLEQKVDGGWDGASSW